VRQGEAALVMVQVQPNESVYKAPSGTRNPPNRLLTMSNARGEICRPHWGGCARQLAAPTSSGAPERGGSCTRPAWTGGRRRGIPERGGQLQVSAPLNQGRQFSHPHDTGRQLHDEHQAATDDAEGAIETQLHRYRSIDHQLKKDGRTTAEWSRAW
jgi:hypothetical protein